MAYQYNSAIVFILKENLNDTKWCINVVMAVKKNCLLQFARVPAALKLHIGYFPKERIIFNLKYGHLLLKGDFRTFGFTKSGCQVIGLQLNHTLGKILVCDIEILKFENWITRLKINYGY